MWWIPQTHCLMSQNRSTDLIKVRPYVVDSTNTLSYESKQEYRPTKVPYVVDSTNTLSYESKQEYRPIQGSRVACQLSFRQKLHLQGPIMITNINFLIIFHCLRA